MEGKTEIRSSLMLLAAAVIGAVAFVAQSVGMDYVGPLPLMPPEACWEGSC